MQSICRIYVQLILVIKPEAKVSSTYMCMYLSSSETVSQITTVTVLAYRLL